MELVFEHRWPGKTEFSHQRLQSSVSHVYKKRNKKNPPKQILCLNEELWQQRLLQRWGRRSPVSDWAARNRLNRRNQTAPSGLVGDYSQALECPFRCDHQDEVTSKSNHPCWFDQRGFTLKFFKRWQQHPMIWFQPSAPLNNHNKNNDLKSI